MRVTLCTHTVHTNPMALCAHTVHTNPMPSSSLRSSLTRETVAGPNPDCRTPDPSVPSLSLWSYYPPGAPPGSSSICLPMRKLCITQPSSNMYALIRKWIPSPLAEGTQLSLSLAVQASGPGTVASALVIVPTASVVMTLPIVCAEKQIVNLISSVLVYQASLEAHPAQHQVT